MHLNHKLDKSWADVRKTDGVATRGQRTNEEGKTGRKQYYTHHGVAWRGCCASRVMHLLELETPTGRSHRLSPRLSRILWCATIGRDPFADRIFAYETHHRSIRKATNRPRVGECSRIAFSISQRSVEKFYPHNYYLYEKSFTVFCNAI